MQRKHMSKYFLLISGLLAPTHAWAFIVPPPPGTTGGGMAGFVAYVGQLVPILRGVFIGFAFLMLFLYAAMMILYSNDESAKTEAKSAYAYAMIGMAVVGLSSFIAAAIAPSPIAPDASFVRPGFLTPSLENMMNYAKWTVAIALMVNIVIQGFRLVLSQGEQEYIDRARKRLFMSFVGAMLVILAQAIVVAVNPGMGANLNGLTDEGMGIANFLLAFVGTGAVIAIIIAGIFLVVSVDESLKEKAKTIIKSSIIALLVVLVSYALVNTFINIATSA